MGNHPSDAWTPLDPPCPATLHVWQGAFFRLRCGHSNTNIGCRGIVADRQVPCTRCSQNPWRPFRCTSSTPVTDLPDRTVPPPYVTMCSTFEVPPTVTTSHSLPCPVERKSLLETGHLTRVCQVPSTLAHVACHRSRPRGSSNIIDDEKQLRAHTPAPNRALPTTTNGE